MPPEEPCFNVLVGALSPPAPVDTLPAVTEHVEKGGGGGVDSAAVDCRPHGGRTTLTLPTRVRVEIMGSQKCGIVGKSQSILIMIHPIISTRTRAPRTPPI
jgi:hypothetical protein